MAVHLRKSKSRLAQFLWSIAFLGVASTNFAFEDGQRRDIVELHGQPKSGTTWLEVVVAVLSREVGGEVDEEKREAYPRSEVITFEFSLIPTMSFFS